MLMRREEMSCYCDWGTTAQVAPRGGTVSVINEGSPYEFSCA